MCHCNLFSIARIFQDSGVSTSRILFLNLVCAPEGLKAMAEAYPEIEVCQLLLKKVVFVTWKLLFLCNNWIRPTASFQIITGAVDSHLNADKYIVPGLGDYGDRFLFHMSPLIHPIDHLCMDEAPWCFKWVWWEWYPLSGWGEVQSTLWCYR